MQMCCRNHTLNTSHPWVWRLKEWFHQQMVLLGAPRGNCRALVMLGWDNLSVTQFIVTPARLRWVLKSRTPVPPAALSVRSRSLKMWDQEHRRQRVQSKQNKSVCLSAGWGVLYSSSCFETQDRGCSLCCWNVQCSLCCSASPMPKVN